MKSIIGIVGVKEWVKEDKKHYRTYVILEDGTEAQGYGKDFSVGDLVEYWFDDEHGVINMRKHG